MKNEDRGTTVVEEQTKRIPSLTFLALAAGSIGLSLWFMMSAGRNPFSPRRDVANFIGQWVPSLLILGTYNKIAKTFSAPYSESQRLQHGGHAAEFGGIGRSLSNDQSTASVLR